MVSNYDRIFSEIGKESQRVAAEQGIDADALIALVMEVVDLEDRHRTQNIRIRQIMEEMILTTGVDQLMREES